MANLYYGSRGDDVRQLQEQLRAAGYNIAADGAFGAQTQAAVRDYQQRNGLQVDGIVGNQTRSSLAGGTGGSYTVAAQPAVAAQGTSVYTGAQTVAAPSYNPVSDSAYQKALTALENVKAAAPTYANSFESRLNELYDKIANREKFSYDVGNDALYKQYAEQYARNGNQAMQDTMGQAAALTGGYGSSYGQNVGHQAYNAYMAKLNDMVPELEKRAHDRYQEEGDKMLSDYKLLGARADDEYQKYKDAFSRWSAERDAAQQAADLAYQRAYQLNRDAVSDSRWERQFAASQAAKASSGSRSGGSSSGGGNGNTDWFKTEMNGAMQNLKRGANAAAINEGLNDDVSRGLLTREQKNAIMANVRGAQLDEYYRKLANRK